MIFSGAFGTRGSFTGAVASCHCHHSGKKAPDIQSRLGFFLVSKGLRRSLAPASQPLIHICTVFLNIWRGSNVPHSECSHPGVWRGWGGGGAIVPGAPQRGGAFREPEAGCSDDPSPHAKTPKLGTGPTPGPRPARGAPTAQGTPPPSFSRHLLCSVFVTSS